MGLLDNFKKNNQNESGKQGKSEQTASFNIEVGDAEMCKIDYSKTVQELVAFYNETAKRISEGDKEYLNGEFMMLGYAIDFLEFAQQVVHISLDFEEGVVPAFDSILDALSKSFQKQPVADEIFNDIVKKATGFMCVVIWKNIGGGFINSNLGYGVQIKDTNAFIYNRIGRRLQGAENSDMVSLYATLKNL